MLYIVIQSVTAQHTNTIFFIILHCAILILVLLKCPSIKIVQPPKIHMQMSLIICIKSVTFLLLLTDGGLTGTRYFAFLPRTSAEND